MENQAKIWARALFLASRNKTGEKKEKIAENLIKILKRRGKIYILPQILAYYRKSLNRMKGELTFARQICRKTIEKIEKNFAEILKETDVIQFKIDKKIIGGFILKTENFLVDGSIKGFLERISGRIFIDH